MRRLVLPTQPNVPPKKMTKQMDGSPAILVMRAAGICAILLSSIWIIKVCKRSVSEVSVCVCVCVCVCVLLTLFYW